MMNTPENEILDQIARFRKETGMAKTKFGKSAVGDANLVDQLIAGRELRRSTLKKVIAFMAPPEVSS